MDVPAARAPAAHHLGTALVHVRTVVLSETAAKLGISVDQLRSELQAGTPLADIAAVAAVSVHRPPPTVVPQDQPPGSAVDLRL